MVPLKLVTDCLYLQNLLFSASLCGELYPKVCAIMDVLFGVFENNSGVSGAPLLLSRPSAFGVFVSYMKFSQMSPSNLKMSYKELCRFALRSSEQNWALVQGVIWSFSRVHHHTTDDESKHSIIATALTNG
jgi:hypothetical protein